MLDEKKELPFYNHPIMWIVFGIMTTLWVCGLFSKQIKKGSLGLFLFFLYLLLSSLVFFLLEITEFSNLPMLLIYLLVLPGALWLELSSFFIFYYIPAIYLIVGSVAVGLIMIIGAMTIVAIGSLLPWLIAGRQNQQSAEYHLKTLA